MRQSSPLPLISKGSALGDESTVYQVSTPESASDYLEALGIHQDDQENMIVLFLDTRNNIKGYQKVTRGLIDRSHVHPREIFRAAIMAGAAKVILSHNHPSGDTSPSKQDISSNNNLTEAGELIGIKVIDHIIVGERLGAFRWLSLRSSGHMS